MSRVVTALLAVLIFTSGAPPIRYTPRVIDKHFATRMQLCPEAPSHGGAGQSNECKQSIGEFLGGDLREIQVHQIGDSFPNFTAVERQIREVIGRRPQSFSRYSPWAEPTPLAAYGILGTLRYNRGRNGHLEISGTHLCFQDGTGNTWWARVGPVDVWR